MSIMKTTFRSVSAPASQKRREAAPRTSANVSRAVPTLSPERQKMYAGIHQSERFTVDAANKLFSKIRRKK